MMVIRIIHTPSLSQEMRIHGCVNIETGIAIEPSGRELHPNMSYITTRHSSHV